MQLRLKVKDIETADVISASWGRSLDSVVGTLTFNLPYHKDFKFNEFDAVEFYVDDEIMVNGYIAERSWEAGKSGFNQTYVAHDKIGLAEIKNVPDDYSDGMLMERLPEIIEKAALDVEVEFRIVRDLPLQIPAKNNLLDFLRELRIKYGLWVYSTNDGKVVVQTPTWFTENEVKIWEFVYGENIVSLSCSSSYSFVHTVIVIGNSEGGDVQRANIGVAIDYVGKETFGDANGVLIVHRNDLFGQEACEEVARNILVKKNMQAKLQIEVPFMPQINVGDVCVIKNLPDEIPEDRKWIVRSFQHSISKNCVTTKLTLAASPLLDIPSRLLTGNSSLLDRDMLV